MSQHRNRATIKAQRRPEGGAAGGKPETVRIRLLGGFQVTLGTRTIEQNEWRLRKATSLVKLLALSPNHHLHREQAMEALWPDLGMRAASNNLRQTLHSARRTLDPAAGSRYLVSQDESLVLCPEGSLWVDVEAFEEAARTARSSREPAAYRATIELYAGELLPADRYEEWAEEHRRRLREVHLSLLLELARLCEEHADYDSAIEALMRVVAEEPTREEAHAGLMRLYALSGSRAEALARYGQLEEILAREPGAEPAASSRALREEIAAGRFPLQEAPSLGSPPKKPPDAGRHNLPAPRTSFVGRERELVEVKRTLPMTRLLTLTGTGGSGKTRLALEVARDLISAYPDGVRLVELAPLSKPQLVTHEVAAALEVPERPGQPLTDTLVDALGDKELLLVLDNCEHLVEAVAQLVDALLDACPHLRVLATSREALGVRGEVLWTVPPLSLPAMTDRGLDGEAGVESLMRYEAVRLFVDRARLRLPDFGLTQENAGAVATVCRKLDGIPLAIELATARMGALAVEQVAERLESSLDLLRGTSRTAEPRQQTLRATLDWSHKLLSEAERALFRRLSVFAGGWTLEAAEAVCSGDGIERDEVLDFISSLVDKSLIVVETSEEGRLRYRMLEPVRQHGREKLEKSSEAEEVRRRHAAFFLTLAEKAEPELRGPNQREWLGRLKAEHDNLRAALSWALDRKQPEYALRFGGALWRFWVRYGHWSEGQRWLEEALAKSDTAPPPVRANALIGLGTLTEQQGSYELAVARYEESLALYREVGDSMGIAFSRASLGWVAMLRGDHQYAVTLLEESLARFRELGDTWTTAGALEALATIATSNNSYARATELYEESLTLYRESEDSWSIAMCLGGLGWLEFLQSNYERAAELLEESLTLYREIGPIVKTDYLVNLALAAVFQGDHRQARELIKEGLALGRQLGDKLGIAIGIEGMAVVVGLQGKTEWAARLWGAAEALREAIESPWRSDERSLYLPHITAARTHLDEQAWEAARTEGRAMTPDEAVEYALSKEECAHPTSPGPEKPPASEPLSKLTRREQEVALLVSRGLTNRQISSELMVSQHTVATHIRNILKKLGLRFRTQIAGWFTDHKPLH